MSESTIVFILSLIAMTGSITGNIFINYKRKVGFLIWTVANVIWILVNCMGELNYPQVCMFGVYSILNIQVYKKWSKNNNKGEKI